MIKFVRSNNRIAFMTTGTTKENFDHLNQIAFGLDKQLKNFSIQEQSEIQLKAKFYAQELGQVLTKQKQYNL